MNKNIKKNLLNSEKKLSVYGLFQDIYTLGYCIIIIPICIYNIFYQTNMINWKLDLFSYIYFTITGIINLYFLEYDFIIHHIICLSLIYIGNHNNNLNYYLWLSKCYLAEVSNIFLSTRNVLRYMEKNKIIINKNFKNLSDILFLLCYFGIRIFYLIPITINYLINNYKSIKYFNFIFVNIFIMILLNLYWSCLIIKKASKSFEKK